MPARHIAGRRRWSVWQPAAALGDEGRANEEFLRQTVMTHVMIVFNLYDRSCSVGDSRSPPTLSKYRRVRSAPGIICLLEGKRTDFLRPITIIFWVLDGWIFKLFLAAQD